MRMARDLSERTRLACQWLLSTKIRNQDPQRSTVGSVNDAYHLSLKGGRYSYAFTEITGYAVSFFANLARWYDDARYLEAAKQAGDYLLRIQDRDGVEIRGAFLHSQDLAGEHARAEYYAFDAAMCIDGLIDLYQITKENKYQAASELAGRWLVEKMQRSDGSFLALYDGGEQRFGKIGLEDLWYYDGGCLHAKNAIALLKLAAVTGQHQFKDAATKVCDWVLKLQAPNGAFWRNGRKDYVFTHAHCYAIEGLIYAAWVLGKERYWQAAVKAAEWLLAQQGRDGAFLYEYQHTSDGIKRLVEIGQRGSYRALFPKKRADATAQAVRIWIILHSINGETRYLDAGHKAIDFLCSVQCVHSSDLERIGGIYHGCLDLLLFQQPERLLSSWCTMFAASAMHMFNEASRKRPEVSKLVSELF